MKFLVVDNDLDGPKELKLALRQAMMTCEWTDARSSEEALRACAGQRFDCAIVKISSAGEGMKAASALIEAHPEIPVIVVAANGNERMAVNVMQAGAADYIAQADLSPETMGASVSLSIRRSRLRRKAADQLSELEAFAAVLAHDLSSPVASMQLFAHAIETDLNDGTVDKTELLGLCREVVRAGKRTSNLIDTLYTYTKIEPAVPGRPVDMGVALSGAVFNLSTQIAARNACVTNDPLPWVMGNEPQLVNLLQNLIGNAIKFCVATPPEVHVSASLDQSNVWVFAVRDNGIGILAGAEERVFDPLTRLNGVAEYEGSGLGLAICRKLVSRHGGVIRCQSNGTGKGSTFFFTLPAAGEGYELPGAFEQVTLPIPSGLDGGTASRPPAAIL